MKHLFKNFLLIYATILTTFTVTPTVAAPLTYDLVSNDSKIEFTYLFSGDPITGQFPDFAANLSLDFKRPSRSGVTVTVQTRTAVGGFVFATQALRGPKILATQEFPTMQFISRKVTSLGNGRATIDGDITVRGKTKPFQLEAVVMRAADVNIDGPLILRMTGRLNRKDFGANGYPDFVGDILDIVMTAKVKARK